MTDCCIRQAQTADAAAIAALYNHYVCHTTATLQSVCAEAGDFALMIDKASAAALPFLVATGSDNALLGYCYIDLLKNRCGYRHTYENSIYVAHTATKQGVGNALMVAQLAAVAPLPVHKLVSIIGLPNPASVALHEKFGYKACGILPQVGWKFNRWNDVGYWLLNVKEGAPT